MKELSIQSEKDLLSIKDEYGWNDKDISEFWARVLKSVDVEIRKEDTIRGISGIEHKLHALGVDEKRGRVVVVSSDPDSRMAALMQSDLQPTFDNNTQVIVARPIVGSMNALAKTLSAFFQKSEIELNELLNVVNSWGKNKDKGLSPEVIDFLNNVIKPALIPYIATPSHAISEVLHFIRELSKIDISTNSLAANDDENNPIINLTKLIKDNPLDTDIKYGICGIPLYSFTENGFDTILNKGTTEDIRLVLKDAGVYQYFYPPKDQAILGICDRYGTETKNALNLIENNSVYGHILDKPELVGGNGAETTMAIIDELKHKGMMAEGSMEITADGKIERSQVNYKPREGFLSKLGIKLDLHNHNNF